MRASAAAPVLVALVALAGSACLGSYGRAVQETREGLVGLTGRDLRRCLGPPDDFLAEGEFESITYHWYTGQERTVRMGNKGPVIIGSDRPEPYDQFGMPKEPQEMPFCQLDFELVKGHVTSVTSHGRSAEGLNNDGKCLMRARPCLYDDSEYVEE